MEFFVSPRPGTKSADNVIQVYWDDEMLVEISAGAGGAATQWRKHTFTVKASNTTSRLLFKDVGISNGLGAYVDQVSLVKVGYRIAE